MDQIGRIIDQLYESGIDAAAWPAALASICELMGADHAIGMVRNNADSSYPFIQAARVDQANVMRLRDVAPLGMALLQAFPERAAFDYDSVIPRAQMLRSDLFNDYIRPMGGHRAVAVVPYRRDGFNSFFMVCRGERAEDFTEADVATLNRIVPHVTRAVRIRLHVDRSEVRMQAAFAAFDQIDAGLAIVGGDLRPFALNRHFERIVAQADGFELAPGGLAARDRAANQALQKLVWRAASDDPRVPGTYTMLVRRAAGRPPWSVTVRRLEARPTAAGGSLVALLVDDIMREPGNIEPVLTAAFGLTPREAMLAAALARGDTLARAAEVLGITYGTARIYLKAIFAKTHTRRQADLVALILRLTRFSG